MGDLKHRSPEELRNLIRWCETKRAENERDREVKRDRVLKLEDEILAHGRMIHNIGQKEAWARIYLARHSDSPKSAP